MGVAEPEGQQQLADLSLLAAAAAVYCPHHEVHQQLQLIMLSGWLGRHLAGGTGGEPEGIERSEDTAASGQQSMGSREGVQWEGGSERVWGKGTEEGRAEDVQMITWAALALADAEAAAARAAGEGAVSGGQGIDRRSYNRKEQQPKQQQQQEEKEEQLRKVLEWQREASAAVRGFLCTALERCAGGMVHAASSERGHVAMLGGMYSMYSMYSSSSLECLRVLAAAASVQGLVIKSSAANDGSSVSATAPAGGGDDDGGGGGQIGLGSSSSSTIREGSCVLEGRILSDLQRVIEGLWVERWIYTSSEIKEKQQEQEQAQAKAKAQEQPRLTLQHWYQQQLQEQRQSQLLQQQLERQEPKHMIVFGTLQLEPLVVAAFSMLKLQPSQTWVNAITDNIINRQHRRVFDQSLIGSHLQRSPNVWAAKTRAEAEHYLWQVLSLLMSLATVAAPVPSVNNVGGLMMHYWLLASDFPSDSATAAAFAQQRLQGKGLLFLRMLLWLYCSKPEDVNMGHQIRDYAPETRLWMAAATQQSLAEISNGELLGFVRAYTKAPPAAIAEFVAGALMQRLKEKLLQWTRQQQQQGTTNQQQQEGGHKSLPFAEMLETCVAVRQHLQAWGCNISTVQQLVVQQLATASEQLPPSAAVQLWSYAVHLQQQGKLGCFGGGHTGENQLFHAAAAAMEARILAGDFQLAEAAAAVLAMQRVVACGLDHGDSDFSEPPKEYNPFWSSRPGFRRAPEMLMVEVWQEVVTSTNPWAWSSPLPAALGPALLALDLSMWAASPGRGAYWEARGEASATAAGSTGQLPPPPGEDDNNAGLVPAHYPSLVAPCLQALQQVIEGVAGNLACFSPQELAEAAYGLLLLGCDPAFPDSSVTGAADLAATAAAEASWAANESSTTTISGSSSSGMYSGGGVDGLATKWPVLQVKASSAVAPLLQQIYQQLLLVVEQQLMAVAANISPPTASASGVLEESVCGHQGRISAPAADDDDAGVSGARLLSHVESGINSSTSSSFSHSGSMGTMRQGTDSATLDPEQQQQLGVEKFAPGTAVRAVVVLLSSGLWAPGVEAAEKLAALTAGGLHQMTWRERAQAIDVVEYCLAADRVATAAAAGAAVDDGGGGVKGSDGSSRGSVGSVSGLEEVTVDTQACKSRGGGALIAHALYIERSPVGWRVGGDGAGNGSLSAVSIVSSSSSDPAVSVAGLPLVIRAWLREFEDVVATAPPEDHLREVCKAVLRSIKSDEGDDIGNKR